MSDGHTPVGGSTMLYIGGSSRSTRCECGTNVFTRLENNEQGEHIYQCNGCGQQYAAGDSK